MRPRRRVCNRVCLLQGLFYRVISGDVTPFRLVRLSAEELLSKEMSEWRKPDAPDVNAAQTKQRELPVMRRAAGSLRCVCDCFWQERGSSSRAHSGQSKQSSRHSGTHSMDVDEAPPASDADVCIPAASSSARRASAPVSGCELLSKLSHCFHVCVCVCVHSWTDLTN